MTIENGIEYHYALPDYKDARGGGKVTNRLIVDRCVKHGAAHIYKQHIPCACHSCDEGWPTSHTGSTRVRCAFPGGCDSMTVVGK